MRKLVEQPPRSVGTNISEQQFEFLPPNMAEALIAAEAADDCIEQVIEKGESFTTVGSISFELMAQSHCDFRA